MDFDYMAWLVFILLLLGGGSLLSSCEQQACLAGANGNPAAIAECKK